MNCCRCGITLTEENWPRNARKYKRNNNSKIWHICVDCFKTALANAQYKFHTGLTLIKRPKPNYCELCGKLFSKISNRRNRLAWHHWDDLDTSKGIWSCCTCHDQVEYYEHNQAIIDKYLELKRILSSPIEVS
jgi:hypothetical protein